ncbi:MAG: hypothetical protein GC154_16850 [bacterium]|nr:hypothetical protein [bacterium]
MPDRFTHHLPSAYEAIERLQKQFDEYQRLAFPERGANFFALELNGEAGELANLEKKAWKGKRIDAAEFADEAADVLIALLNYCNARCVNLARAAEEKMIRIDDNRVKENQDGREME